LLKAIFNKDELAKLKIIINERKEQMNG